MAETFSRRTHTHTLGHLSISSHVLRSRLTHIIKHQTEGRERKVRREKECQLFFVRGSHKCVCVCVCDCVLGELIGEAYQSEASLLPPLSLSFLISKAAPLRIFMINLNLPSLASKELD